MTLGPVTKKIIDTGIFYPKYVGGRLYLFDEFERCNIELSIEELRTLGLELVNLADSIDTKADD